MYHSVKSLKQVDSLPSQTPLADKVYSLEPDMLLGWRPRLPKSAVPIPLRFDFDDYFLEDNGFVVYNGFRPKDSLMMHECFGQQGGYRSPVHRNKLLLYKALGRYASDITDQREFEGVRKSQRQFLHFNSCFEGGNLDKAVLIGQNEYDLYMRTDSNTKGHQQWFYFSVSNISSNCNAKFNILNFTKKESLYAKGMKPVVFIESYQDQGWHRIRGNVEYRVSKLKRHGRLGKRFYQLVFDFEFKTEYKKVYFAYAIPYSYSKLLDYLQQINQTYPSILKQENLCKTLSGIKVPLLTIQDNRAKQQKDVIFITARVHPGETHASFVLEGLLNWLLGESEDAISLRKRIVFKIIPMLNIDGVIMGNYRTSLAGIDLNRSFITPDQRLNPVIFRLKQLLKQNQPIFAYLDLHGHSRKKGVFVYGPHYPLHTKEYFQIRILPKMIGEATDMFRYPSCNFRNDFSKRKAARLVVNREFKVSKSYTLETSLFGYLSDDRQTVAFTEYLLVGLGEVIIASIQKYVNLLDLENQMQKQRQKSRKRSRQMVICKQMRKYLKLVNESTEDNQSESDGSDSNPSEGELQGSDKDELFEQILSAIEKEKPNIVQKVKQVRQYSSHIKQHSFVSNVRKTEQEQKRQHVVPQIKSQHKLSGFRQYKMSQRSISPINDSVRPYEFSFRQIKQKYKVMEKKYTFEQMRGYKRPQMTKFQRFYSPTKNNYFVNL